jgi:hypothetical protein
MPSPSGLCAVPPLAKAIVTGLTNAIAAARDGDGERARRIAVDAGRAGDELHDLAVSLLSAGTDRDLIGLIDGVAILGQQGSFLFEDSADSGDSLPDARALGQLEDATRVSQASLKDLRTRMDAAGLSGCWRTPQDGVPGSGPLAVIRATRAAGLRQGRLARDPRMSRS